MDRLLKVSRKICYQINLPADKPRFVIYVAVDSPKKQYYGSQVAAPLFAHIASYALIREGLAPLVLQSTSLKNEIIKVPEHKSELQKTNDLAQALQIHEVVPELRSLTLREVHNVLESHRNSKIDVRVAGDGNVVGETEPMAGQQPPTVASSGLIFYCTANSKRFK